MFCTKCGNELHPNDKFCAKCGAEVRGGGDQKYGNVVFNPPFRMEAEKKTAQILKNREEFKGFKEMADENNRRAVRSKGKMDWNLEGFPESLNARSGKSSFDWDSVIERRRSDRSLGFEKLDFSSTMEHKKIDAEDVEQSKAAKEESVSLGLPPEDAKGISLEELEKELYDLEQELKTDTARTAKYEPLKSDEIDNSDELDAYLDGISKSKKSQKAVKPEPEMKWNFNEPATKEKAAVTSSMGLVWGIDPEELQAKRRASKLAAKKQAKVVWDMEEKAKDPEPEPEPDSSPAPAEPVKAEPVIEEPIYYTEPVKEAAPEIKPEPEVAQEVYSEPVQEPVQEDFFHMDEVTKAVEVPKFTEEKPVAEEVFDEYKDLIKNAEPEYLDKTMIFDHDTLQQNEEPVEEAVPVTEEPAPETPAEEPSFEIPVWEPEAAPEEAETVVSAFEEQAAPEPEPVVVPEPTLITEAAAEEPAAELEEPQGEEPAEEEPAEEPAAEPEEPSFEIPVWAPVEEPQEETEPAETAFEEQAVSEPEPVAVPEPELVTEALEEEPAAEEPVEEPETEAVSEEPAEEPAEEPVEEPAPVRTTPLYQSDFKHPWEKEETPLEVPNFNEEAPAEETAEAIEEVPAEEETPETPEAPETPDGNGTMFYTFSKKNEAFQELLRKERERLESMGASYVPQNAETSSAQSNITGHVKGLAYEEGGHFVEEVVQPIETTVADLSGDAKPNLGRFKYSFMTDSDWLREMSQPIDNVNKTRMSYSEIFAKPLVEDEENKPIYVPKTEEEKAKAAEEINKIFDEDEQTKPKSHVVGNTIIILLLLVILFEGSVLAAKLLAPDSKYAHLTDGVIEKVMNIISEKKDGGTIDVIPADTGDNADAEDAYYPAMIAKLTENVKTIGDVQYNANLTYSTVDQPAYSDILDKDTLKDSEWQENDDGQMVTYAEAIYEAVIAWYDGWQEDNTDSELVGINSVELGEIKKDDTGYYVLTKVIYADKDGGTTETAQTCYLTIEDDSMFVNEIREDTINE